MATSGSSRGKIILGIALAAIAVLVLGISIWQSKDAASPSSKTATSGKPSALTTVAVLPFQNMSGDKDSDFLRLALPDEMTTTLSYVRSLSIRPFATSSKYGGASVDVQQAGQEMHVSYVVTGHFLKAGNQLEITLEAVDVANNRTLWHDTLTAAAPDLIAMRSQIAAKVKQGLVPALGAGNDGSETFTRPNNEEAYDLYLRSLAVAHDPVPNKEAITMLERAVGLDPNYAPAWAALGHRYSYDADYSDGGEAIHQRSNAALERALALDPNLISASEWLITNQVNRGNLLPAYFQAKTLVERHPESAGPHFALSYVLRYGGAT